MCVRSTFRELLLVGIFPLFLYFRDLLHLISPSLFLKMSGPSDRRFDLNFGEEAAMPSQDNIWHPSFLSPTGPLTVRDSVMKNDMTAAVVARNLLTLKDNRLLSKQSDELAIKDSLALSVQCAVSVSNMAQRLFARTHQVESLAAEVISLKQEI